MQNLHFPLQNVQANKNDTDTEFTDNSHFCWIKNTDTTITTTGHRPVKIIQFGQMFQITST